MNDSNLYPKLRWPLDLSVEQIEGKAILLIRDPLGIAPRPLALVAAVTPLIASFEGKLSVEEIAGKFAAQGATKELVNELLQILDQNLYLSTPKYMEAQAKISKDFLSSQSRAAALAGAGYPEDPAVLRLELDRYLGSNGVHNLSGSKSKDQMVGLVAPHIDYNRGGKCYGVTYNKLLDQNHDLYLLFGTSHQYSSGLFHLTKKHFESPLGELPCDTNFVELLANRYGYQRSFADELLHRREHSLELQVPFIREIHLRKNGIIRPIPKIVPVLVGSFHQMYSSGKGPEEFDEYESFVSSLAECAREELARGLKICFIAGVDMAHLGRAFGDAGALSPEQMKQVELRDQIYLEAVCRQDKKALFAHVAEDQNARKICGFPTLYTMIDLFSRLGIRYSSEVFDYSQAVDYGRDCAVTFAGVGLYSS